MSRLGLLRRERWVTCVRSDNLGLCVDRPLGATLGSRLLCGLWFEALRRLNEIVNGAFDIGAVTTVVVARVFDNML